LGFDAIALECFGKGENRMSKLITPGDPAPDFELKDVQGNLVRLSDFCGQPLVLAFLRGFM
jgi:peroxiredoxin